ncbi:hypothetical protein EZJ19_05420 [Parasulfuritortus cantonensis]|uniref:DUF3106 domain-containing protein n=1 Tax=Parasulfuritortus cantonensis TaxID=2528202 RepID=A0A4R1BGL4_9PROT|nr:hypothetical protein [Parasulfuritortus cantonensis]TCJ16340.1 hypothetical protein EZJ19_05420 [Parasulfuritortus cantonensis]
MNATCHKLILTALAVLATGTAFAADRSGFGDPVFSGQVIGPVADWGSDERARFRNQWEQLPPDQREAMRYQLRQEWDNLPPEARQKRRNELMNRMEERQGGRRPEAQDDDSGYGQGYGTRPWGHQDKKKDDGRRNRYRD